MSLFSDTATIDAPAAAPAAAAPISTPPAAASAPEASASSTGGWINATTGELEEGWVDHLPAELKAEKSLTMYKDVATLAKSLVATKKLVGTKLERPGPDASPERIEEWRKITGAPKDVSGYGETLRPEDIPESMWDGNLEKGIKEVFHKHHAAPELLKEVVELYGQATKSQLESFQQEEQKYLGEQKASLAKEWGNDLQRKLSVAQRFAQTLGLDPSSPEFANAAMVKAMYAGATLYSGSTLPDGGQPAGAQASVRDQIDDITNLTSSSQLARDYRGENGRIRQAEAQAVLHNLMGVGGKTR
jgi:hypothetical protein